MDLRSGFGEHFRRLADFTSDDRVVVACSGGLDSTVLLHLLCFTPDLPRLEITVAHFDHRMRPSSEGDARWVKGLAAAWGVPSVFGRAERPLASEDEARHARYAFLTEVRKRVGARWVLTAHHADDQAETVLFRVLRGTGLAGLRGIPARGTDGLLRPLLPFRRAQLETYAKLRGVRFRVDPSNADLRYARNVIRREILPRAESTVAPGATGSLLRLARLARQDETAWTSLMPTLLEGVVLESGPDRVVMARPALLAYHPAVRARLLRHVAGGLGVVLGEAGTRAALEFTSSSGSGRRHSLSRGLVLAREFDRLVVTRFTAEGEREILEIHHPGEGQATFTLAGRSYRVEWTRSPRRQDGWAQAFASECLRFPLRLRGWAPGDRIRMGYGTKKLKKLFAEMQVPAGERMRRPVLEDGEGSVIWVPGLARSAQAPAPGEGAGLIIALRGTDLA